LVLVWVGRSVVVPRRSWSGAGGVGGAVFFFLCLSGGPCRGRSLCLGAASCGPRSSGPRRCVALCPFAAGVQMPRCCGPLFVLGWLVFALSCVGFGVGLSLPVSGPAVAVGVSPFFAPRFCSLGVLEVVYPRRRRVLLFPPRSFRVGLNIYNPI
jgi:hypothetical protein